MPEVLYKAEEVRVESGACQCRYDREGAFEANLLQLYCYTGAVRVN
jgi:hypothetical protein